jgi:hypothetical protein
VAGRPGRNHGDGRIDAADNALEATTALYFVVNSDDDNGNGIEDYLDDGPVENEDDLVEIRLLAKCPPLDPATAWWSISWIEPDPKSEIGGHHIYLKSGDTISISSSLKNPLGLGIYWMKCVGVADILCKKPRESG